MGDTLDSNGVPIAENEDELQPHIPRVNAAGGIPPMVARGISPQTAEQTEAAQNELGRLRSTGSGISQLQQSHPIAGGIVRGLSTIGSIVAPRIMTQIPGTEQHHNYLIAQQEHRIGEGLGEQQKEATIPETQSRTEQAESEAERNRADIAAAGQPKPKEEKWSEFPGFTDNDGTPLIREENSGQVVRASDKKRPTGFKPIGPKAEPDKDKDISDYLAAHNLPDTAANREKARGEIANRGKQEPGNFMPLYDDKGHVTGAWDPKSGRVINSPNLPGTTSQGAEQQQKTAEQLQKQQQPYQDILDQVGEAREYAKEATGPGDYALLLRVVDATKPAKGFRFTQSEQNLLIGARSLANSADALYQKAKGGQLLTPEQRQQMLDVLGIVEKHAQEQMNRIGGGGQGANQSSQKPGPENDPLDIR